MNPLRALFLSLSKMPPAVMLLVILGLAVIVTMTVTGKVAEQEKTVSAQQQQTNNSGTTSMAPANDSRKNKVAFYTLTYIPATSKIESKQVEQRKVEELELWEDAILTQDQIVGHTARHAIPENTQIRAGDIE
jgi:hypothetical protein